MKNIIVAVALACVSLGAYAGPTVILDYDVKDKQNVANKETHNVLGLSINTAVSNNLVAGIKFESEWVKEKDKPESLTQLQFAYMLPKVWNIQPSINLAIGEKYKVGNSFEYYVVGSALKMNIATDLSVGGSVRLRAPFDGSILYKTVEYSAGVEYNLSKNLALGARYKIERGDSDYNTVNFNVKYVF
jgi:hypothetical protein